MTSLQKAKAFFESKGKKLALAVAPLAMIAASAVPAHASLVISPFPSGPGGSITGGNGSASGGLFATPVIGSNGLPGLSITGSAVETATNSGGTTLTFSYAGSIPEAFQSFFPSSVPIEWHFLVTPSNNTDISWNLTYSFWDASTPISDPPNTTGGFSGSALNVLGGTSADFQGLGDVNLPATLANFRVDLNVLWSANGPGSTLTVDIPTGSLDINTPAPEPGSYLLMGAGMGLLALRARRKSRA
jgi:PEP-CTERM motif